MTTGAPGVTPAPPRALADSMPVVRETSGPTPPPSSAAPAADSHPPLPPSPPPSPAAAAPAPPLPPQLTQGQEWLQEAVVVFMRGYFSTYEVSSLPANFDAALKTAGATYNTVLKTLDRLDAGFAVRVANDASIDAEDEPAQPLASLFKCSILPQVREEALPDAADVSRKSLQRGFLQLLEAGAPKEMNADKETLKEKLIAAILAIEEVDYETKARAWPLPPTATPLSPNKCVFQALNILIGGGQDRVNAMVSKVPQGRGWKEFEELTTMLEVFREDVHKTVEAPQQSALQTWLQDSAVSISAEPLSSVDILNRWTKLEAALGGNFKVEANVLESTPGQRGAPPTSKTVSKTLGAAQGSADAVESFTVKSKSSNNAYQITYHAKTHGAGKNRYNAGTCVLQPGPNGAFTLDMVNKWLLVVAANTKPGWLDVTGLSGKNVEFADTDGHMHRITLQQTVDFLARARGSFAFDRNKDIPDLVDVEKEALEQVCRKTSILPAVTLLAGEPADAQMGERPVVAAGAGLVEGEEAGLEGDHDAASFRPPPLPLRQEHRRHPSVRGTEEGPEGTEMRPVSPKPPGEGEDGHPEAVRQLLRSH